MPDVNLISLFPLPSTVFFPSTLLPLHIFEPRYRTMIEHSIETGQGIGMVLLQPDWEETYYGRPEINPIGCAGKLEKWLERSDGKYDIVLRGQSRFRVVREVTGKPYREAEIEFLPNANDHPIERRTGTPLHRLMSKVWTFRDLLPEDKREALDLSVQDCRTLGNVVDRVAYQLDLALEQKQVFLEELDVAERLA
ncbi:MAG: LON peptidase substrate-binding domain-containing protein, partial [Nitrospinaceae bacterium]